MSTDLCDRCVALCCRYFALPIDNPDCAKDFDNIRWYLVHENVVIFVEKKQWYIGILNRCKHLQNDNRCGIYQTRPKICRSYSNDNCDYHGGDYGYEQLFTSAEQLRLFGIDWLKTQRAENGKKQTGKEHQSKDVVRRKRNTPPRIRLPKPTEPTKSVERPQVVGRLNAKSIALPLLQP